MTDIVTGQYGLLATAKTIRSWSVAEVRHNPELASEVILKMADKLDAVDFAILSLREENEILRVNLRRMILMHEGLPMTGKQASDWVGYAIAALNEKPPPK